MTNMASTDKESGSGDGDMRFPGVFKSLEAVKKCLQSEKYSNLPEVKQLMQIFNDNYSTTPEEVLERSQRKVFIVLEGIDASGKTTISQKLSKLISGRQMGTPPPLLLPLREQFDAPSTEIPLRRAYYALGNYIAAQQVRRAYTTGPVIMDRFWHSTAAYAIAQQALDQHNGSLPPEGDPIYEWPADLLKPDIVFFLSVSEGKRIERLMRRKSKPITREELKLKDVKPFRDAMFQVYQRMKYPRPYVINADHYPARVLKACVNSLLANSLIKVDDVAHFHQSKYLPLDGLSLQD